VTAKVIEMDSGRELTIRARFLVGCDGAKSQVREQLGFAMDGKGVLTYTTNVIFRCPEFNRLHDKQPGYRYLFVGPTGTWATIVAINGRDNWRMSIIGSAEKVHYTDEELKQFAYRALGRPFPLEILSVLRWQRAELVAERYHEGRVFICGDACHLTSPTGGLGMNTGIGDAVDLSWKLSAALEGWGGPALFDSYDIERIPVARRITRFSTSNLETMKKVPSSPKIAEDSEEGRAIRLRVGHAMSEGLKQEWFSMNMHLGNRYIDSPINVYDEVESREQLLAEYQDPIHYRPSSRPGCRAPHAWLKDGRSTLDLFGRGFVLLALDGQAGGTEDTAHYREAARRMGMPFETVRIDQPEIRALYEKRYVLVRPDGHVAWRGDALPQDPAAIVGKVTGHTSAVSETIPQA
ncbi:MAG: 2-polyprenyl-6-methoxyphenol hydroxylase, partial [Noviherbaspirillum sp.]|nr:2-polyprenyl-6-methoxyphenol hydroxylase [Noviherbaspirillum sp.]